MDDMIETIGDVLEALDGMDIDDVTSAIISAIGLEVDPNVGPNNEMIRYQTRWFER